MSEASYQRRVIRRMEADGWYCIRLLQTNKNGIPDYLVMKMGEDPQFIEFKAKGEKPDPLQEYRHEEIYRRTGVHTITMTEI